MQQLGYYTSKRFKQSAVFVFENIPNPSRVISRTEKYKV